MFRALGRHAGMLALGLVAVVAIGPLAVFSPAFGALALGGLALIAAAAGHVRAARLRRHCEKLSQEADLLSKRLLKLETLAVHGQRPDVAQAGLRTDMEELSVEIGLLSGMLRDLAGIVTAQDGEIEQLKRQGGRAAVPEAAHPAPAAEPSLPAVLPPPLVEPAPAPAPAPALITPAPAPPVEASTAAEDAGLVAAFDGAGLEVHLQPVVSLPQRKVVAYEALARLRIADAVLAPDLFLPALERHGRAVELDRRMLRSVSTVARHLASRGSEATVSYGLSPLSLADPGFLRHLDRLVGEDAALANLVVALPQESWRSLDPGQAALLGRLRGRIGFLLDRPDDLRFDAGKLAAVGVGQVKVPADLLLRPDRPDLSDIAVEDLVAALARSGIRLTATGVDAETDVPDLIDIDVPFGQGPVFSPPRPVRTDVLAAPPAPAPSPEGPGPEPADPEPQRRPFRAFLRRAV